MTQAELNAIRERCNAANENVCYALGPIIPDNEQGKKNLRFIINAKQDITTLLAEIDCLQRERDVAVEDMTKIAIDHGGCMLCRHSTGDRMENDSCKNRRIEKPNDCWQWRGLEDGGEA